MKIRVAYLNRQAKDFRTLGEMSHDPALRAQLFELAQRCEAIALNINKNMPIHERVRDSG